MVVYTYNPKHWRGGGRRITSSLRVWATRDLLWREVRGEKTKSSQHHRIGLNRPGEKEFCYCCKGTWPKEASWPLYSVSSLECANKKQPSQPIFLVNRPSQLLDDQIRETIHPLNEYSLSAYSMTSKDKEDTIGSAKLTPSAGIKCKPTNKRHAICQIIILPNKYCKSYSSFESDLQTSYKQETGKKGC